MYFWLQCNVDLLSNIMVWLIVNRYVRFSLPFSAKLLIYNGTMLINCQSKWQLGCFVFNSNGSFPEPRFMLVVTIQMLLVFKFDSMLVSSWYIYATDQRIMAGNHSDICFTSTGGTSNTFVNTTDWSWLECLTDFWPNEWKIFTLFCHLG
jgi:hypothetical protein